MKTLLFIWALFIVCQSSRGQQIMNVANFQPELKYDNVHLYQIDTDPHASTYIIWVKKNVAAHHHADHTEIVYVLEGEGEMTLGDIKRIVRPGDYIFIPRGTAHSVEVKSDEPMKVMSIQTPQFDGTDRVFVSPE